MNEEYNEEELTQMISDCLCEKRKYRMNQWEHRFMVNCQRKIDKQLTLSPGQCNIVNATWDRVTANG